MGSEVLVSIVIPTYKGEKFIKQTVESVMNQTYSNFEL
ncbi:MAG: glycosyltransferase, partial [Leuconostoc falkenbergense]